MKTRNFVSVLLIVLSLALLLVSAGLSGAPVSAGPLPAPQTLNSYTVLQLFSGNGITQTANGTQKLVAAYDTADCYSVVDVTSNQTLTMKLQHSADGSNWVDLSTFPAVSADGVAFTNTLLYGAYLRAGVTTLGTSNPVTATLKCVLKD